jgi:hypothetical protein
MVDKKQTNKLAYTTKKQLIHFILSIRERSLFMAGGGTEEKRVG